MDMVRCPRCAKQIPSMSRFCGRCGCAVSRTGGFGMQAPPPVPTGHDRAEPASSSGNRSMPLPPAKQGSGMGTFIFVLIAIVTALMVMSSRRSVRPRTAPPPARFYQPSPRERLNAVPWHFQIERQGASRVAASIDVYSSSSGTAENKRRQVSVSADQVIDRIIRKASEYLDRIEADRGAIHKSVVVEEGGTQP